MISINHELSDGKLVWEHLIQGEWNKASIEEDDGSKTPSRALVLSSEQDAQIFSSYLEGKNIASASFGNVVQIKDKDHVNAFDAFFDKYTKVFEEEYYVFDPDTPVLESDGVLDLEKIFQEGPEWHIAMKDWGEATVNRKGHKIPAKALVLEHVQGQDIENGYETDIVKYLNDKIGITNVTCARISDDEKVITIIGEDNIFKFEQARDALKQSLKNPDMASSFLSAVGLSNDNDDEEFDPNAVMENPELYAEIMNNLASGANDITIKYNGSVVDIVIPVSEDTTEHYQINLNKITARFGHGKTGAEIIFIEVSALTEEQAMTLAKTIEQYDQGNHNTSDFDTLDI